MLSGPSRLPCPLECLVESKPGDLCTFYSHSPQHASRLLPKRCVNELQQSSGSPKWKQLSCLIGQRHGSSQILINFYTDKLQCQVHGRDWKQLGRAVPNKTETQIKNYFQNYKSKVRNHPVSLQLYLAGLGFASSSMVFHLLCCFQIQALQISH